MDLKEHLKTLTELHAPSGHEMAARTYLREAWKDLVASFEVDGLGSLIGIKPGTGAEPRRRIMLSAHMDEIALVVAEIRDGYIRTIEVNGFDSRVLQGKSVIVHGKRPLLGTVAAVPPHISGTTGDGRKTYPKLDKQWIDLGLPAAEVNDLVTVGDLITMEAPLLELKGDRLAGKAMDDRASVAAVTHCLELLQGRSHQWDVYAVASVQEEMILGGAHTAPYAVKPDLAIALDVSFAKQPGANEDAFVELGKGPALSIGPNFHPGMVSAMQDIAKQIEMSLPIDPLPGNSGTDAWAIQVARQGIPTILLNIPLRNMHSPVETVSLKDIKRTGRLMAEFIASLDEAFMDKIAWKRPTKEKKDV